MAFAGLAVIQQVGDGLVRVTGLSLSDGSSGTISLAAGAGDVKLPASFNPTPYSRTQTGGSGEQLTVDLAESIEISIHQIDGSVAPAVAIVKTPSPFLATFTNNGPAPTGDLEMYFRFHN